MSKANHEKYASFRKRQAELAQLIDKTNLILDELGMDKYKTVLERIERKVSRNSFKVQVVGTFKNGKSTFINSFLGEEILPAYALPCTAVINEVKYAKEKYAKLYFKNPLPKDMPEQISPKAKKHMERYMYASVPPLRIEYDEIEDYVVIPMGKDPAQMLLESPYSKVELYWPLPLLENGVEIIDSPGLNEHATRTKVTMEYLSQADAILFVLNAQAICTRDEMNFVENNLKAHGFDDPYFIVNRFDCIKKEEDRMGIKKFAKETLAPYTNRDLHFVSARNALDGKQGKDEALLESSGMVAFENDLADYLTKYKGKTKLAKGAGEVKRIINEEALMKVIPMQKSLINSSLDSAREKYEKAKPQLDLLNRQKNVFSNKMRVKIDQFRPDLTRLILNNYRTITDSIPLWLGEYKAKVKLGLFPSKMKINAVAKEIGEYLSQKLDEYQTKWNKETLLPFIKDNCELIFEGLDDKVREILSEVEMVNSRMMGTDPRDSIGDSAIKRVKAGNFATDILNFTETAALNDRLGKFFSMMCLGSVFVKAFSVINPITALGTLTGKMMGAKFSDDSVAERKIKETICEEALRGIRESCERTTAEVVRCVSVNFNQIADSIISALDAEITECDNQMQSIIAEMEKGREYIKEKEAMLEKSELELAKLNFEADKLILKLVEGY